jgi:hypothetical protein
MMQKCRNAVSKRHEGEFFVKSNSLKAISTFAVATTWMFGLNIAPSHAGVSPSSGGPGDVITITGSGFGTDPDDLLVYVTNDTSGAHTLMDVISASDTVIVASVGIVRSDAEVGEMVVARGVGGHFDTAVPGSHGGEMRTWHPPDPVMPLIGTGPFDPQMPTPDVEISFYSVEADGDVCLEIDRNWPKNVRVIFEMLFREPPPPGSQPTLPQSLVGYIDFADNGTAQECAQIFCDLINGFGPLGLPPGLNCTVTQVGANQFKLTISADVPIEGLFNLHYTVPVTYGGFCIYTTGLRAKQVITNNSLKVSNIGGSGKDGARLILGESQGLHWDLRVPATLPPDAQFVIESRGKVGGIYTNLSRTTFEYQGSEVTITPDLSVLGATSYERRLYRNGQLVHQQSGVSGPAAVVTNPTQLINPTHHIDPAGCSYSFTNTVSMDVGTLLPVSADTLVITCENPAASPECMSSLMILASNIPEFNVEETWLMMFPQPGLSAQTHRAAGEAGLHAMGDRLEISNIGSSGLDGARVDFDELGPSLGLPATKGYMVCLYPCTSIPDGAEFSATVRASIPSEFPGASQVQAGIRNSAGVLGVSADFSGQGVSEIIVEVYQDFVFTGSAVVAGETISVELTNEGGPLHQLSRFGTLPSLPFGIRMAFDHPGTFTLPDSTELVGNDIRLLRSFNGGAPIQPQGAGPAGPEISLMDIEMLGIDLGTLFVSSETILPYQLSIQTVNGEPEVSWSGVGYLQAVADPAGTWQDVSPVPAQNPYIVSNSIQSMSYRVRE